MFLNKSIQIKMNKIIIIISIIYTNEIKDKHLIILTSFFCRLRLRWDLLAAVASIISERILVLRAYYIKSADLKLKCKYRVVDIKDGKF